MARIRILTDSASDIPDEYVQRFDIGVVSLTIRFGEDEFANRSDLTPAEFWDKCKNSATLPETSAPSPGAFQSAYEHAQLEGYDGVLVLTLSSLLSATYQSACVAAEAVAGRINVRVLDTKSVSMGQGLIVIDVAEAALTGANLVELARHASDLLDKSGTVATLDTLEHLIKGGRVGGAKALLGQVLSIKPLIEIKDGVVNEAGRQRTRSKALSAVVNVAHSHEPLRRLALIHGACSDVAVLEALASELACEHPLVVADISSVVGTHGGPGIIGLTWITA